MSLTTDFRILLIGDYSVGKREILIAFEGRKYATPVAGIESRTEDFIVHGNMVKVELCDSLGMESSAKLNSTFYEKTVQGVFLIYDDTKSFDKLHRWLDDVNQNIPNVMKTVLCYERHKKKCDVSIDRGRQFATNKQCEFEVLQQKDKTMLTKIIQNMLEKSSLKQVPKKDTKPDVHFSEVLIQFINEFCQEFSKALDQALPTDDMKNIESQVEQTVTNKLQDKLKKDSSTCNLNGFIELFKQGIEPYKVVLQDLTSAKQEDRIVNAALGIFVKCCKDYSLELQTFVKKLQKSPRNQSWFEEKCLAAQHNALLQLDGRLHQYDTALATKIKSSFEQHSKLTQQVFQELSKPKYKTNFSQYKASDFLSCKERKFSLGKGGFAFVHLAFHDSLGWVAIKTPNGGADVKFLKEGQIAQMAHHPNVVETFGIIKHDKSHLVMEYMPGGSLDSLIFNKDIKHIDLLNLKLRIFSDIASGLAFLHNIFNDRRISHNDIKPHNVLMTYEINCKISDFGGADLAAHTHLAKDEPPKLHQYTPIFASPERLDYLGELTKASDVYSFGMTGYCILEESLPTKGRNDYEFQDLILEGKRPTFTDRNNLSDDSLEILKFLQSIVVDSWQHSPKDRPSMLNVRNRLLEVLARKKVTVCMKQALDAAVVLDIQRPPFDKSSLVPFDQ